MSATHYDVLGVAAGASASELHRAYVRAARAHHPDRSGGDADRMREINRAWEVLGDPVRRAEYDRRLGASHPLVADPEAEPSERDVDLDVDLDDVPFAAPVVVAPTGWLAVAPVAVFGVSVALFCAGLVMSGPALLVLAVAVFFVASAMFVLSPLVAMSRGRARRRR
jgi:hypothetical protein